MIEPRVIPRADHPISRHDIDPDALKVLYRLRQFNHIAYLVGGSVRDLLLGRKPKDFDIGTSAHPYQVKRLFRNCWIIGRRFRLAHVKFGTKVVEVATFRRQVQPGEEIVTDGVPAPQPHHVLHHENTFGTPEEDAFRRDFTINALFYDIATFSIIDYVNGMDDLRAGIVRSIGDPELRFREDPVRMLRAVALAARLGFRIDPPIADAIRLHRHEIARSSPARLLEEYYKILRSGYAEKTFRGLAQAGLLEPVSSDLLHGADERLWHSLAAVDAYRARFESIPDTLTNAVLLGSLLVPLGFPQLSQHQARPPDLKAGPTSAPGVGPSFSSGARDLEVAPTTPTDNLKSAAAGGQSRRPPGPRLGELPLARRDVERLGQILALQRRLRDLGASPRAKRALTHRGNFREALTWLEIHGNAPAIVEHWITVLADRSVDEAPEGAVAGEPAPFKRRRRRRRRRYRPAPGQ